MNLRFVWFIEFTVNQCVAFYVTVELTIFYIHTSYSEKKTCSFNALRNLHPAFKWMQCATFPVPTLFLPITAAPAFFK